MMKFGRRRVLAAGAALAASKSAGAQAQADYPDHAIRFVGGCPPGHTKKQAALTASVNSTNFS